MERLELRGDGVVIVADAAGPEDGRPVIFLHGGGQTRQSWGKAVSEAARRGYRSVAVDLRGHGESGWSSDGFYGMAQFTADLRAIIEVFSQPPVLVGASLGGLTSLSVAGSSTPLVAGLILVDVAVHLEEQGTSEILAFMTSAPEGFATPEEAADAVAAYLPHRSRPKRVGGLMRNLRLRDGRYHWHWDPALMRPGNTGFEVSAFEKAARQLSIPTLLVRGGLSKVLSKEGATAFLKLVPAAEYVDVEGADHMVAGDANDAFNAAVFTFLERHVPSPVDMSASEND